MGKKAEKSPKTNAMRELDVAGIAYRVETYEVDENDLSGVHAAESTNADPECMFKTLVTVSPSGDNYVFCIPVAESIDLKKAAKHAGVKSLTMLHVKDLLKTTGYIRGGCSPLGMQKRFPTFIDETAILFDEIYFSGGKRGVQIVANAEEVADFIGAQLVDLTVNII